MSEVFKLSKFVYKLPEELIAKHPSPERGESRMMIVDRKKGKIEHKTFRDILKYFSEDDVMVFNNTKVFPARLWATKEKTGAKIEVFLLRELNGNQLLWDVLVDPARKIRVGNKLYFGDDDLLVAEIVDNTTSRGRTIRFLYDGDKSKFREFLFSFGETPIPKYIASKRNIEASDKDRYQTVYAKHEGAVAAPTAGLHFTKEILKRLEIKGVNLAEVTLHTGLGSFRTIDVEDLSKHKMDAEYVKVGSDAVALVNEAKDKGKKVISVGTTVMRSIESGVTSDGRLKEFEGWTNLFIYPPYDFSIADCLLTNFHLPKSSLFIMTCAYGGYDLIQEAYKEAVKEKYNFFTYGDCMLII